MSYLLRAGPDGAAMELPLRCTSANVAWTDVLCFPSSVVNNVHHYHVDNGWCQSIEMSDDEVCNKFLKLLFVQSVPFVTDPRNREAFPAAFFYESSVCFDGCNAECNTVGIDFKGNLVCLFLFFVKFEMLQTFIKAPK